MTTVRSNGEELNPLDEHSMAWIQTLDPVETFSPDLDAVRQPFGCERTWASWQIVQEEYTWQGSNLQPSVP